ncbi:short-chain dehydrogenase [Ephemerocybe angulata]|uniref:Short-chain dehydrogenase n=1 Tax=Ephemerocybe angulata TaxID=980116 RepID=A0A8H6IBZ2_9AGAR|nr:short-chain dehydrogenase [Tulosesus angulatus]
MTKPVVVVTGASRGIGLAVTRFLLSSEFNAVVVAISRSCSPELFELGLSHKDLDISLLRCHHSIDALILNAGVLEPVGKIASGIPLASWKSHFDVNFFSLVTALQASLPALRKSSFGGRVVFISSGAAVKGTAAWGPYNASKAAMNSLCRTVAEEEPDVISVALRPGMVDTNMQADIRAIGGNLLNPSDYAKFVQAHADNKLVKPEDCGHVIAALALQAPKSLSGQFVSWDGEECKPYRKEGQA